MPETPMTPRPKRRIVADLDHQIEVGGATLVRVKREAPPELTLEDIAKKYAAPEEAAVQTPAPEALPDAASSDEEPDEEHREFVEALRGAPEPSPGVTDMARRLELFSQDPAVIADPPHPETNPDKRAEGALAPLILTGDAPDYLTGREKPETLLDLFSMFPLLDGANWFIYVNRLEPKIHSGLAIRGVQRPINRVMSFEEWQYMYGGGSYELTVYGPPKNGLITNADGRVSPKKMTEPIKMNFPGPPSFNGMVYGGEDPMSQDMQGVVDFPQQRGPRTMADASVEGKKVDVAAQETIRRESREDRERAKSEQLLKEKSAGEANLMKMFLEANERAADREAALRSQLLEQQRDFAESRDRDRREQDERLRRIEGDKKPDETERLVNLATVMTKSGGAPEQHARELERLQEQRTRDNENFQAQMRDARDRADRLVQEERERSARLVKDAEERFHVQSRDAVERASADVQRAKDECEKRLNDQHRQHLDRIADLDRNHARDITSKEASHQMAIETLKMTYDLRLDQAKGEVKRISTDVERYRKEADDNKDVVGKIAQFKEQAAELGMVDASEAGNNEPETVPQMLMKVGANVAGALPQIIENIGAMMRGKNDQELAQARLLGQQEAVRQLQGQGQSFAPTPQLPAGHQRRGAPRLAPLPPIGQSHQPPLIPGHEPNRHDPRLASIRPINDGSMQPEEMMRLDAERRRAESQQALAESPAFHAPHAQAVPPPAPALPGENSFHTGMPPEPQYVEPERLSVMPPPPLPPPPALSAAPPAADPAHVQAVLNEDRQIVGTEMYLLPPLQEGQAPAAFAKHILTQAGPEQIQQMMQLLGSADRVIEAFERIKGPDHPFARREGKKFLRGVFSELGKLTA